MTAALSPVSDVKLSEEEARNPIPGILCVNATTGQYLYTKDSQPRWDGSGLNLKMKMF
jgi:hypothetical protein